MKICFACALAALLVAGVLTLRMPGTSLPALLLIGAMALVVRVDSAPR